jgi:hypothetical protein
LCPAAPRRAQQQVDLKQKGRRLRCSMRAQAFRATRLRRCRDSSCVWAVGRR